MRLLFRAQWDPLVCCRSRVERFIFILVIGCCVFLSLVEGMYGFECELDQDLGAAYTTYWLSA